MSRLVRALCALALAAVPTVASASISTSHQRPDAFRHAINAVIGDVSYVERFGTSPKHDTDPDLRVRTHLEFVHALLSARDVSMLPKALRVARRQNLERLREYIDAGVFPRNHLSSEENRPCFVDRDDRICAVGYLVEQSAGREAAERINSEFQSEFLWRIDMSDLDRWIAASGLSLLELSMIQPCYDPNFLLSVTRISEMSVAVRGYVLEDCCGMKYVAINFGEAVWKSPDYNFWYIPVDIVHNYSNPGSYAITAVAVSTDWCNNQVEYMSWVVSVGVMPMKVSAVEIPGGPPYRVYLTTSDPISSECLTSSVVSWSIYDPPQATSWYSENGVYRTPAHEYSWSSVQTITVSNTYRDDCALNQAGSVTVNINGVATATHVSTWGRIKAMYR